MESTNNPNGVKVHLSSLYTLQRGDLDKIAALSKCQYAHVYAWWHRKYKDEAKVSRIAEMKAATMLIISQHEKLEELEKQLIGWLEVQNNM